MDETGAAHFARLAAGAATLDDLRARQAERSARVGGVGVAVETTAAVPDGFPAVVESGGSVYWEIAGFLRARQRVLGAVPAETRSGKAVAAVLLDPEVVETAPRFAGPCRGWAAKSAADVPPDSDAMPTRPRVVDLFCGCGGMAEGFRQAGFDVAAGLDNGHEALAAFRANIRTPAGGPSGAPADLSDTVSAADLVRSHRPTVVTAGPPCQDFSSSGSRKEGERADLTVSCALILAEALPEWAVIENVPGMERSVAYRTARTILKNAGYGLTERVLDADLYGVAQARRRFFCLARLGGPDGSMAADLERVKATAKVSVRQRFAEAGHDAAIDAFYRHPHNWGKKAIFSLDRPSPTIRGVNRPMPAHYGERYHPLTDTPNDADPREVPTGRVRSLTSHERALLQGFPPDWSWPDVPKSRIDLMVGNAVPVGLARAIASAVMGRLADDGDERGAA